MLPYVSGFRRAALDFSAKWRLVTPLYRWTGANGTFSVMLGKLPCRHSVERRTLP